VVLTIDLPAKDQSMVALILSLPNWGVIVALIGLVAAMVYIFAYRSYRD
jgi:type II secretory pathway component PulF